MKRNIKTDALTGKQLRHHHYVGRKIVVGAMLVTMFTCTTVFASASFNDLSSYDWAANAINDLASKDIIKGIGDGKFAPANNVTRQEFAIMAIRAMGGDIDSLAAQASQKAATSSDYTSLDRINQQYPGNWSNNVICAIQNYADLDTTWGVSKDEWSANATRADMAFIVMTIAEQSGKEQFTIKDGINNNIGDYNEVSRSPYANSILKAYSNGILVGTNSNGDYEPSGLSNRAQAAVVMQRVIDPSTRTEVVVKVPEVKPPVEGENIGEHTGTVYPTDGMTINGKTVTRDPNTGVLGFGNGQNGYIYSGIQIVYPDGSTETIKPGTITVEAYDNMKSGDTYTEKHGYCYWDSEWALINKYAYSKLPKPSAQYVGQKADINGNIIQSGTAFWECQPMGDAYQWKSI